ncbi:hypothetical protein OS493_007445 [Desmophyllum pertusum]|uniref:Uncharacterized protein n=1 Tax=Desmophyllum pertusum TaxID=174260 RepID=A0A9W9Z374_9CNID|nr:hypothetical protein OS493_007445 [Desmophyllum pertusum]
MALLFIITLLSLTGTMVASVSSITSCDAPLSNTTCTQANCTQPPCTMLCGQTTPYDSCEQQCDDSTCSAMKCDASGRCLQSCSRGTCQYMTCDANSCFQTCNRATCGVMKCVKEANNASYCEQAEGAEMICESETCSQTCSGNCSLTCTSSVKMCTQYCINGGICSFKCEADKCKLNCKFGTCTEIKPSTTKMPESSGGRLRLTASVGLGLMFAAVAFM